MEKIIYSYDYEIKYWSGEQLAFPVFWDVRNWILSTKTKRHLGAMIFEGHYYYFIGSKQECIDMYNKNFERPYSTLQVVEAVKI